MPRVSVLHRPAKQGLGVAYRDGFRWVLERPDARAVVQMDADFSHDPADLPRLLAPLMGNADLVLGTRYMPGGSTVGWPWYRRLISRGGTLFARTVLLLPYRDLTGGFKAWRREILESIRLRETSGSGYGFQIETTWWAHRRGASIVQVPIVFRERAAGASKMSRADRRRGDGAGREAARGGRRRLGSASLGRRLHPGHASARMAARPNPAADQGRMPSRRMTTCR